MTVAELEAKVAKLQKENHHLNKENIDLLNKLEAMSQAMGRIAEEVRI